MTQRHVPTLRKEFVKLLTTDVGKTKRSKDYNQAVFLDDGKAAWAETTLDMILQKFDQAWDNVSK